MAIVKPEYIADLQKSQDLKFWRILDSSGKLELNRCLQDIGLDASIDMLQKDLENTSGDFVVVKLYSQKPTYKETGTVQETAIVRKVSLSPMIGKAHSNSYGSSSNVDMIYMLMKEQRQSDNQYRDRLQELEMKILEMNIENNKQDSVITQIINALPIIQSFMGGKNQLTGSTSNKAAKISGNDPETDSTRLAGVLDKFASLDPDYINTLEKMAAAVEENPNILPALKSNL